MFGVLVSLLIPHATYAQEPKLTYLKPEEIPELIAGLQPPVEFSVELEKDITEIKKRIKKRTDEDCHEALSQQEIVFGTLFSGLLTQTEYEKVFDKVVNASNDLAYVVGKLKKQYPRVRPIARNADLVTLCPGTKRAEAGYPEDSFPSGHAAIGYLIGLILNDEIQDTERHYAFMERARKIGYNRTLLGVHYPSDVKAGQELASRFYRVIRKRLHSH